jgi:hypothetical protein
MKALEWLAMGMTLGAVTTIELQAVPHGGWMYEVAVIGQIVVAITLNLSGIAIVLWTLFHRKEV